MDNHEEIIKQLYPIGEERWLKVKYLNPELVWKSIRFDNPEVTAMGFEFTAIGTVEGYMPQVEALVELKAEMDRDFNLTSYSHHIQEHLDRKIQEVLSKVLITK